MGYCQGADASSYSIYIHSEPGFVFDESTTRSPIFFGRQLSNSIEVCGIVMILHCYVGGFCCFFGRILCFSLMNLWCGR